MILTFKEKNHEYKSLDEDLDWLSVTSFVSYFKQPFDPIEQAQRSSRNKRSKWYGMDPMEIQYYWKAEGDRASLMGTWYHSQREKDIMEFTSIERNGVTVPIIRPIYKEDIKIAPVQIITNGVYPEHFVYLKSAGLCGQSDRVEVVNHSVSISDYKGLDINTPIPTSDGFKSMNDIIVGDRIFDGNGELTTVDHISDIHYNPCYKITFDTNDHLICDHEHKWVIAERKSKNVYIETERTTTDIYTSYLNKEYIRIKCSLSLNIKDKELLIDPYVLGVWLGDGSSSTGHLTNMNEQIWKEIENRGYIIGRDTSNGGSGKAQGRTIFGLRAKLKKLNLLNNKHIPDIYIRSSHQQRLDLLRGFMDTDGYYNRSRNRCVMATTKLWQAEAIMSLVSSLGGKPTLLKTIVSGFGKINIPAYNVTFKSIVENPFLCRNKDYLMAATGHNEKAIYRYIKKIERVNTVPTKCLSVDSSTHTYLAGPSYIKTHNTNKELRLTGYTNWEGVTTMMNYPVDHLPDCHLTHYALQLSLYLYMILKHNHELSPGKLSIEHVIFEEEAKDEHGYPVYKKDALGNFIVKEVKVYEVPFYKTEVISMINYLRDNRDLIKAKKKP